MMKRMMTLALALCSCGSPEEAARVQLPVAVDASGIQKVTTDSGYEVTLTSARLMVEDFEFTIAGEAHSSLWQRLSEFVLPTAYAHPGHYSGGDVTGELSGRYLIDWFGASATLGEATLLVGDYESANFSFARGTADDGLASNDPLLGHTAVLEGTASKGGQTVRFSVVIDAPEDRELIGAPFDFEVSEGSTAQLGFRLLPLDPYENDSLFDGVDFAALDADGDGTLSIGPSEKNDSSILDAYNQLRRTFLTHDHFDIRATQPN